jgi:hypothetical protein
MANEREGKKNEGEKESYPICIQSTLILVSEYGCRGYRMDGKSVIFQEDEEETFSC